MTWLRLVVACLLSLSVAEAASPVIVSQPQPVTLINPGTATFTVGATGTGPLAYQWYKGFQAGAPGDSQLIAGATEASFTTPVLSAGAYYWVRVSNASGFADSQAVYATVILPPTIGSMPNHTLDYGETTTLIPSSVNSLGFTTLQWYAGESGDTSSPIDGATRVDYVPPPATDTLRFWIRVTNAAGSTDSGTSVILVRPKILTQPAGAEVPLGEQVTLSVGAVGSGPLTYQWYRGLRWDVSDPVAGAVDAAYAFTPPAESVSYWVRVTGPVGTADSAAVVVAGVASPSITAQPVALLPADTTAFRGTGMARVTAQGGGLHYQWYRGETGDTVSPVEGATGALLLTPPLREGGRFWVRVSNLLGTLDSDPVTLAIETVLPRALRGMGANSSGQLAQGVVSGNQPVPVRAASDAVEIAAGNSFSLFVKADDTLWAVGSNSSGQLGDGSNEPRTAPVQIATGVAQVAAGGSHTLFLKRDGTLWATGENGAGQLGLGNYTSTRTPKLVATGVAKIAAGLYHSLFLRCDGSLWAMGGISVAGASFESTPVQLAVNVTQIAAGAHHSLFVDTAGRAWGVGSSSSGTPSTPAVLATGVARVAAGGYHSLFVKTDGTLWAFGSNASGQLGDGSATYRTAPVQVASDVADAAGDRAFGSGLGFSLFVKRDGTLWAMGANGSGQLGDGSTVNRLAPVQVASNAVIASAGATHTLFTQIPPPVIVGQSGATAVVSGQSASLQVEVRSELAATYQWYFRTTGAFQPVAGATAATYTTPPLITNTTYQVRVANATGIADSATILVTVCTQPAITTASPDRVLLAGQTTTLSVTATGGALGYQWYFGLSGDMSTPVAGATGAQFTTPPLFESGRYWVRVSNLAGQADGAFVFLTVFPGAQLMAVGKNSSSQLGLGDTVARSLPAQAGQAIIAAAAGDVHTLFITADRTLWGVGGNGSGQLGDGTLESRLTPVAIAEGVQSVVAGPASTFFIKTDGSLWATGDNSSGHLGLGAIAGPVLQPTLVTENVAQVATSGRHTLVTKKDGTLWAMGNNLNGQLGLGTVSGGSAVPVQIATQVMQAAAGQADPTSGFSAFIKTDGTLWGMGYSTFGQLGTGGINSQTTPRAIAIGVAQVAAGPFQLLFVKQDGTLWGTGGNLSGVLGIGSTASYRLTPVQIATQVAKVATGMHTFILKQDGSLWGTGPNTYGQLGDGTTTTRLAPVQIATGVLDMAIGTSHSLFLRIPAPVILTDPVPVVARVGTRVEFSVGVTPLPGVPLSFQWRRNGAPLTSSTASTNHLAIDSAQLADAGDYDVVVTQGGVSSTSAQASLTVHAEEQTTYAAWAAANAATGGAQADPDGGGTPNLLRFAFKLPAHGPTASPLALQTVNDSGGSHLTVAFTRKTYAPGLAYVIEASPDLVTWSTVATVSPGLPADLVVQDSQPLTSTVRRFLRVRVELAP